MKDYTILLIEDEKNIADFIEKILRSNDYKVVTASTGGEGLSLIKSRCPDIILLEMCIRDSARAAPDIPHPNLITNK